MQALNAFRKELKPSLDCIVKTIKLLQTFDRLSGEAQNYIMTSLIPAALDVFLRQEISQLEQSLFLFVECLKQICVQKSLTGHINETQTLIQLFDISYKNKNQSSEFQLKDLRKQCNQRTHNIALTNSTHLSPIVLAPLPIQPAKQLQHNVSVLVLGRVILDRMNGEQEQFNGSLEWKIKLAKLNASLNSITSSNKLSQGLVRSLYQHHFQQDDLKLSKNLYSTALALLVSFKTLVSHLEVSQWTVRLLKELFGLGTLQRKTLGMNILAESERQTSTKQLIDSLQKHQMVRVLMNKSNHIEVTKRALPIFLFLMSDDAFAQRWIKPIVETLLFDEDTRKLLEGKFTEKVKFLPVICKNQIVRMIEQSLSSRQISDSELSLLDKIFQYSWNEAIRKTIKDFAQAKVILNLNQDNKFLQFFLSLVKEDKAFGRENLRLLKERSKESRKQNELLMRVAGVCLKSSNVQEFSLQILEIIKLLSATAQSIRLLEAFFQEITYRDFLQEHPFADQLFSLLFDKFNFALVVQFALRLAPLQLTLETFRARVEKQIYSKESQWQDTEAVTVIQYIGQINRSRPNALFSELKGTQYFRYILTKDSLYSALRLLAQHYATLIFFSSQPQPIISQVISSLQASRVGHWLLVDSLLALSMSRGPQHLPHYKSRAGQKVEWRAVCFKRQHQKVSLVKEQDENMTLWQIAQQACKASGISLQELTFYDFNNKQITVFQYYDSLKSYLLRFGPAALSFTLRKRPIVKLRVPLLHQNHFTPEADQAFSQIFGRYTKTQFIDLGQCTLLVKDCVKEDRDSYMVRNYVNQLMNFRKLDGSLLHLSQFKQFYLQAGRKYRLEAIWSNLQDFGYNSNLKLKNQEGQGSNKPLDIVPFLGQFSIKVLRFCEFLQVRKRLLDKLPTLSDWQDSLFFGSELQVNQYELQILALRLERNIAFRETFIKKQDFVRLQKASLGFIDYLLQGQLGSPAVLVLLLRIGKFGSKESRLSQEHLEAAGKKGAQLFGLMLQEVQEISLEFFEKMLFHQNIHIRQSISSHVEDKCRRDPLFMDYILDLQMPSSTSLTQQFLQLSSRLVLGEAGRRAHFLRSLLEQVLSGKKINEKGYQLLENLCKTEQLVLQEYISRIIQEIFPHLKQPKDFGYTYSPALSAAYVRILQAHLLSAHSIGLLLNAISSSLGQVQTDRPPCLKSQQFCGLSNLGSTCYMNSVLQQFYMIGGFMQGVVKSQLKDIQNSQAQFLKELQLLFAGLRQSNLKSINTTDFCLNFKDFQGKPVDTRIQQDAPQFINRFLDKLQRVLKSSSEKELVQGVFGGTTATVIRCKFCDYESKNEQCFLNISVEVKLKKNLYESLDKLITPETIEDYLCSNCQARRLISKTTLLQRTPQVLIVQLQRMVFDMDKFVNEKIHSALQFPLVLQLQKYTLDKKPVEYHLRGVIIHSGTAQGGHYFSLIKEGQKWFKFDDSVVSQFCEKFIDQECFGGKTQELWSSSSSSNAYILFYDKNPDPRKTLFQHPLLEQVALQNLKSQIQLLVFSTQFKDLCRHVFSQVGIFPAKRYLQVGMRLQYLFDLQLDMASLIISKEQILLALEITVKDYKLWSSNIFSLISEKRKSCLTKIQVLCKKALEAQTSPTRLLDQLLSKFQDARDSWRYFNQFFLFWRNIMEFSQGFQYCLKHNFLKLITDLVLNDKRLGNDFQQPDLSPLLECIAKLGLEMLSREGEEEAKARLRSVELLKLMSRAVNFTEQTIVLTKQIVMTNPQINQQVCKFMLSSINSSYFQVHFKPLASSLLALLAIPDSLQSTRFAWLLGFPQLKLREKDCPSMCYSLNQSYYVYKSALHVSGCQSFLNLLVHDKNFNQISQNSVYGMNCLLNLMEQNPKAMQYISSLPPTNLFHNHYWDWFEPELKLKRRKCESFNPQLVREIDKLLQRLTRLPLQGRDNQIFGRIIQIQHQQQKSTQIKGTSCSVSLAKGVKLCLSQFPQQFLDEQKAFKLQELQYSPFRFLVHSKTFSSGEKIYDGHLPLQDLFTYLQISFQGLGVLQISFQEKLFTLQTQLQSGSKFAIQVGQDWRQRLTLRAKFAETINTLSEESRGIQCKICTLLNQMHERQCAACGMPLD